MTATDLQRQGERDEQAFARAREGLRQHLQAKSGIFDQRILSAFAKVPRHRFLPAVCAAQAYEDMAIPLALGQTVSQPSMIALMLLGLRLTPEDRVLEVGGGSGYAAALLGELVREVYTVEILAELARQARERIAALGTQNVQVFQGNGRDGLLRFAPYDKILVSAGSKDVPAELLRQLKAGGRVAIPVGSDSDQKLLIGTRLDSGETRWETSVACSFVPLVETIGS